MDNMKKAEAAYLKKIKELLRDRKYRDSLSQFIVEGNKVVQDTLDKAHHIESILCSSTYITNYPDQIQYFKSKNISLFSVKDSFFEKLSVLRNSQGILALVNKPNYDCAHLDTISEGIVILLDNIQDPGNMGALIRTSVAFSAKAILLFGNSVDIYNPKVVRASSGMLLEIPIISVDLQMLVRLKKTDFKIIAADNSGNKSISIFDLTQNSLRNILVFGNEGNGISSDILELTDTIFHIPISNKVESLNVAAACSISLFYFSSEAFKKSPNKNI